ncbi:MAG: fimbrillin family protein, partial [Prevotellaceae bacterium]|nr:fimbrillin family protein [Prevotellaceae bacterium]
MKTVSSISPLLLVLAILSCQSDDIPVQHPDGYDIITFSVKAEVPKTRTNDYISYDASIHPSTMGVFGYTNLQNATLTETGAISSEESNPSKTIFNNQQISYSSSQWEYTPKVQWKTYESANYFDFFGYMPQTTSATLTKSGYSVTLAVPFNPSNVTAGGTPPTSTNDAFITVTKNAPILCALPDHKGATTSGASFERVVGFKFDQTLTGYEFLFQLDGNMNKIRHFKINSVS